MISSKQLILENNEKRKLLTKENEDYYDNMLVYIRLNWKASEQQSEEILMELLDHLIEGQQDGKTAADIFGNDPKGYADELLGELPKETLKTRLPFFSYLIVYLISIFLSVRGIALLIGGFFKPVDTSVFILKSTLVTLYSLVAIAALIWFIFHIVEKSLFKQQSSNWKDALKAGLAGVISFGLGIALLFLIPNFGPSFSFGWLPSLASGALLWIGCFWAKKKFTIF
ncbi:DUF1129 family protein [Sporolactobacillus nakayamae]|uniref:Uncharacterized membrane-anchored protein n=1 Tax=Sporolactobacillus nakayamae TaxID=269670 RepID=A0A1I2SG04_9BACL|nr:DUF1129 family protein [Sporolactobacillus nakayamae]SFG48961.1 Uncharacterized membrane-anchored protein [Sporolactobacillus nakayamae]